MKAYLVAPLLLLTLSGCTLLGGTPTETDAEDDSRSSGSESEELEGGSTGCLIDKNWELDVADAAATLGASLSAAGMTVVSATGEGSQGIYFDQEGYAGSATDVTYTIVVDMGDGLVMTMMQHHAGSPGGTWAWDGSTDSTVVFDGWSGEYTVTTDTSINGTAAPTSTTPMGGGLDGQAMTISCSGDTLETQAKGSPYTQVWHARD